ncbi:hypothetical protein AC578_4657 [Pseudocercospora eumusae]|uniref:Heterokaryon incompatibility domain-containing protein n=1 Tax=Pseudocercospora eumusae TaxID=321146 RepID=A0A139H788_9PEZI|nr:hypothetical protein AC578_4657 [Pseudocercospora eumusae]
MWQSRQLRPEVRMEDELDFELHLEAERMHPEIAPHSCEYCGNIILNLTRPGSSRTTRQSPKSWINSGDESRITLDYVFEAKSHGCALFAAIADMIDINGHSYIVWTVTFSDYLEVKPYVHFHQGPIEDECGVSGRYTMIPIPGQEPLVDRIPSAVQPNLVPASSLSMKRARAWIQECLSSHGSCVSCHISSMPSRILAVGTTERPQLQIIEGPQRNHYVALSYCWGADQPAKTTAQRLSAYCKHIDIKTLPAAVRDAIRVTRALDIPYLWVDAFCIVQDDEHDKMKEIALMQNIYKCSTVVLAATCTTSSTQSFLLPRSDLRPIRMNVRYNTNMQGEMLLVPTEMVLDYTIHKRAWTYQEMAVAPRVLSFEKSGLRFYCLEMDRDEDPNHLHWAAFGQGHLNRTSQTNLTKPHPQGWIEIVEKYAGRGLTNAHDRLPALLALTQAYRETATVEHFLAGLWQEDLPYQLMWRSDRPDMATRAADYVAPTWSWASLFDGGVDFQALYDEDLEELTFTAIVIEASAGPASPMLPYGEVVDGHIILRGRTKSLVWLNREVPHALNIDGAVDRHEAYDISDLTADDEQRAPIRDLEVHIDCYDEWTGHDNVELLALEFCTFFDPYPMNGSPELLRSLGLLILPSNGSEKNVYRRAGVFRLSNARDGDSWLDTLSLERTVKIV